MQGLAVILIIFEGIIINCETNPKSTEPSQNATEESSVERPFLPNDLMGIISGKTDLQTIRKILKDVPSAFEPVDAMNELLEHRIVVIGVYEFNGGIRESREGNDFFLEFGSRESVESFFNKFGRNVKKIKIASEVMEDDVLRETAPNFIKECAKNLNELRIDIEHIITGKLIHELFRDNVFPKVKTFFFQCLWRPNEFRLNTIIPNVETLIFHGLMNDPNCLQDLKSLKVLKLFLLFLNEDILDPVFASNKNIKKLIVDTPRKTTTMESIAKHLTKLDQLFVISPSKDFLIRTDNQKLYTFSKITLLHIEFGAMENFIVDLSFEMTTLRALILIMFEFDPRIIDFVKRFKKLGLLQLTSKGYSVPDITYIKQKLEESKWILFLSKMEEQGPSFYFQRQLTTTFNKKSTIFHMESCSVM